MVPWLDAMPAVPAVGVLFEPRFTTTGRMLDGYAEFIRRIHARKELGGEKIGYAEAGPWTIELKSPDGFTFAFKHDGVIVKFDYQSSGRVELDEEGRPRMIVAPAKPYSSLLNTCMDFVTDLLMSSGTFTCIRIGIVATTPLRRSRMPPGISAFVDAISAAPRAGKVLRPRCALYAVVREHEQGDDRCHYNLQGPEEGPDEDPERIMTLDYQRRFRPGIKSDDAAQMNRVLQEFPTEVVSYFEQWGSGQ